MKKIEITYGLKGEKKVSCFFSGMTDNGDGTVTIPADVAEFAIGEAFSRLVGSHVRALVKEGEEMRKPSEKEQAARLKEVSGKEADTFDAFCKLVGRTPGGVRKSALRDRIHQQVADEAANIYTLQLDAMGLDVATVGAFEDKTPDEQSAFIDAISTSRYDAMVKARKAN